MQPPERGPCQPTPVPSVSRQTISSIETGQFNPTAKLALLLCIALDWKFEDLFYFTEAPEKKRRYF